MTTVNMAANGEEVIVAKAGQPIVKIVPVDAPKAKRRLGFLEGQFKVPEDFDLSKIPAIHYFSVPSAFGKFRSKKPWQSAF